MACLAGVPVLSGAAASSSPLFTPSGTSCTVTSSVSGVSLRRRFPPTGDSGVDTEDVASLGRFLLMKKKKRRLGKYHVVGKCTGEIYLKKDQVQRNTQYYRMRKVLPSCKRSLAALTGVSHLISKNDTITADYGNTAFLRHEKHVHDYSFTVVPY